MVTKKANSHPERSRRMLDKLRARWDELSGKYCNDRDLIDRFFKEIERKYTNSRRHYHNLQHIQATLREIRNPIRK